MLAGWDPQDVPGPAPAPSLPHGLCPCRWAWTTRAASCTLAALWMPVTC